MQPTIIVILYLYFVKGNAQFFFPPFARPIQPLQVTWNNPFGNAFENALWQGQQNGQNQGNSQQSQQIASLPTLAPSTTPLTRDTNWVMPDWHKWPVGPDWNDPRNTPTQQLGWGGNGIVSSENDDENFAFQNQRSVIVNNPLRQSATSLPETLPTRSQIIRPLSEESSFDSQSHDRDYDFSVENPNGDERFFLDRDANLRVLTAVQQQDSEPREINVGVETPGNFGGNEERRISLRRRAISNADMNESEKSEVVENLKQTNAKTSASSPRPRQFAPTVLRQTTPRIASTRSSARKPPATVSPPMHKRQFATAKSGVVKSAPNSSRKSTTIALRTTTKRVQQHITKPPSKPLIPFQRRSVRVMAKKRRVLRRFNARRKIWA